MKKLLALILCVMMFVSVIPMSAYAEWPIVDNPLDSANTYASEIKNMIKHTRENIETAYGVLVMDQVVYNSAKGMDDAIVNLVDGIAKPLINKGKMTKGESDAIKDAVRGLIDEMVAGKMLKDAYKYFDGDKIDPIKYAQTFANSVAKALTDKDFQKGYEAVATYFALRQVVSDINDQLEKDYEKFQNGIDGKFDAKFADRYPELAENFIDTYGEMAEAILEGEIFFPTDPWVVEDYAFVGSPLA